MNRILDNEQNEEQADTKFLLVLAGSLLVIALFILIITIFPNGHEAINPVGNLIILR